jgi:hypothetical protein
LKNNKETLAKLQHLQTILSGIRFIPMTEIVEKLLRKTASATGERLVYRLMKKLKDDFKISIEISLRPKKSYRIYDDQLASRPVFNEEEFSILSAQLNSLEIDNPLRLKLLKTLFQSLEFGNNYSELIKTLKRAKDLNKKIFIKEYFRGNGKNKVEDIHLTPISFDVPSSKLYVFDPGNNLKKTYNFENMKGVKISGQDADVFPQDLMKSEVLDPFGFSKNPNQGSYQVNLNLNQFAYSMLIRQFPGMSDYITPILHRNGYYKLMIEVFHIDPIGRFVTGMFDQVEVIGDSEFKKALEKYYLEKVVKGYETNFKK